MSSSKEVLISESAGFSSSVGCAAISSVGCAGATLSVGSVLLLSQQL